MMPPTTACVSAPPTVTRRARRGRMLASTALAAAVIGYLLLIVHFGAYVPAGSDSSGYFNSMRQLREHRLVEPLPTIPGLADHWDPGYQEPLGYTVDSRNRTRAPTYPVGYPLHLLVLSYVVGPARAAVAVALVLSIASVLLMLGIGRECGLSWSWSIGAAALLLGCPLYLLWNLQPMSDVPATAWTLATIWSALRARRNCRWAAVTGVAFAVAVLVRPSSALLLAPLAVLWGWQPRAWWRFAVAGIPGALFLGWYNYQLYGAVVTTGYGDVSSLFGARFFPHNALHFARWLVLVLTPFVTVPALAAPWVLRGRRRWVAALGAWAAVFLGFYVFYFHSGEHWWYLRFILPAFPALILAGLLVWDRLLSGWPTGAARIGRAAVLILAIGWQAWMTKHQHVLLTRGDPYPYSASVAWAQEHIPAKAILLEMQLSGCFTYHTGYTIVRWDMIKPDGWTALQRAAASTGRPLYALLFDFEEQDALHKNIPGHWRRLAQIDRASVWLLDPSATPPGAH